MTRDQLKDAVVEAARVVLRERLGVDAAVWEVACARLADALAALDAHTEAPQTVTVTLALWRGPDGRVALDIAGSDGDTAYSTTWTRLGVFTAPLNREGGR